MNRSTVHVLVDLSPDLVPNYITVRKRDLQLKRSEFGTFRDFCQHFLHDHNCYPYFKFGVQTYVNQGLSSSTEIGHHESEQRSFDHLPCV